MSSEYLLFVGVVVLVVVAAVHRLTQPDPLHDIPGPRLANYTSLLLAYHTRTGKRYLYIDTLHKQYGPFVRISPTQVSCASPTAPSIIYAQGSASLPKTPFYRAFYVDGSPSLFSTQDRTGHASKRRVLAHPFSYASVKQFEGWIRKSLVKMCKGLDARAGGLGVNAETLGRAQGSTTTHTDVLMWLNYMTFDVISDLAFGEPLGMLDRASDVLVSPQDTITSKNTPGVAAMIDYRGRTAAFLGLFPSLLPGGIMAGLARWVPDQFVQRGLQGTETLSHIAQRCVKRRIDDAGTIRRGDLLDRLLEDMRSKQGSDEDVSEADVVTDAMLLLTAGSDTTANSTAAILYWIYRSPSVLSTLHAELLSALASQPSAILPSSSNDFDFDIQLDDDTTIPYHDQLKGCKYLQATIDEGLRMFATNAFGLPRVVPKGGSVTIEGRTFYEGTELSAPAYTIQHDPAIWGDPDVFRPERWLDSTDGGVQDEGTSTKASELKKYLLTFGMGPRACIGKNLAYMQMQLLVATVVLRYDLYLRDEELKSVEGFMHKPVDLWARVVALSKEEIELGVETGKK